MVLHKSCCINYNYFVDFCENITKSKETNIFEKFKNESQALATKKFDKMI